MSVFKQEPPQWALRLLRFYCKPRALEIIEGDAYELFYKRAATEGLKAARRKFSWDVFRFFRFRYIKGLEDFNSLNNIAMFKNYLKISIRSLLKQKFYSFINISGLALGLAACLLIVLYISHELSYDKYHKDIDRVYRVANGQSGNWTPARLGAQMKADFPEVEEVARINGPFSQTFKVGDKIFKEERGFSADSTFHKIFTMEFVEGRAEGALNKPNTIVLTQSLANKFFDYGQALGQIIYIDGEATMVTGVVADPPKNTHFYYNYVLSYPHDFWVTVGNWTGNAFFTYAKLTEQATPEQVHAKIPDFVREHVGPALIKYSGHATYDDFLAAGGKKSFTFIPMKDLHLHYPHLALGSSGSIDNVYIFSAVALFILLIACINFMNLSTARSAMRSKEVGMRKVLGSLRGQLVGQFMTESVLVCLLSSVLALLIASLGLDGFNQLANRDFEHAQLFEVATLAKLFALMIVVGLMAGSYPALVLSSFQPIKALKGEAQARGKGGVLLRKGLVAFQFAISIFLMVSTVVVFSQLQFLKKQDLGFDAEQVLVVKNVSRLGEKAQVMTQRLEQVPTVQSVSLSSQYPSEWISDWGYQTLEDNPRSYSFINMFATAGFLETMNIELLKGRNFNRQLVSDTSNILINEAAARWLGWEDPIGKKLSRGNGEDYTIIGVMKDFNFNSLKRGISPFVLRLMTDDGHAEGGWYAGNYLALKVSGNFQETVSSVEDIWKETIADEPFEYVFLDDSFNALYEEEERFGQLFTASSGLAIAIACLGLFALAAFTLQRRFKEIAVRKVLGASVKSLTLMVIRNFTFLVFIGAVIAIPTAYLVMKGWLADFAYQMNLNNPLIWLLPALFVAVIAWLTVGFQSVKTAMSNPVKALRSE
ncbi:ABC transporter permease [Roseivirga thermotolerans]|uniref:ABC transporter permease n=1 Tax=Roseivirga thermotolerans TaxID=1758176 RepID=UPI00167902C7|nr:ABC transporter permease [Roseivirga thermotolerans]